MPVLVGGHSQVKPVEGDAEIEQLFLSFQEMIQQHHPCPVFKPICYTSQVVAGTVYHIKILVEELGDGNDKFIHVRVFNPLPHTGQPPVCQGLHADKTAEDPIDIIEP